MLQLRQIRYAIGERLLLRGIDWAIQPAKRVALVGPNGAGKTTLFKIINGEILPDSGEIVRPKGFRIGHLPQEETEIAGERVLETATQGNREIAALANKLAEVHAALDVHPDRHPELLKRLGDLEEKYEALGGYKLEVTAKSILSGLGFRGKDFQRSLSSLSGGWRMRVYLARLLLQNPDLLLLDEPTNHLDLPSLEWLEQYLLQCPGSVVLVSHDRFFIDRLAHEIFELDLGNLEHYAGNYRFYEKEKGKKLQQLEKLRESQEEERKRQEKFIERFRYKASKARQVQSRIKQLAKTERIELPPPSRRIHFRLKVEVPSYKDVLQIKDLSFRYDDRWVLEKIYFGISRGEKVALVGPNGAGKTTLTKLIVQMLTPQRGVIELGKRTSIGHYAQHQLEMLDSSATIYEEICRTAAQVHIPRVRDILGAFQFSGADVFKKIGVLSGGEKARVSLTKILLSPTNFLVMDEPTNHLDMRSVESLEQALLQYDGTLLLISHDRYFLDKIINRVAELKDGHLKEFLGNYSDYLEKRDKDTGPQPVLENGKEDLHPKGWKTKEQKRLEAEARQSVSKERGRLEREIEGLEKEIDAKEARRKELEEKLSNPQSYQKGEQVVALRREYQHLRKDIDAAYSAWEKAKLAYEELVNELKKLAQP